MAVADAQRQDRAVDRPLALHRRERRPDRPAARRRGGSPRKRGDDPTLRSAERARGHDRGCRGFVASADHVGGPCLDR
ncbi:hypothetical protein ACFPRL_03405 [Pseudoclavibacter helvolus]